MEFGSGNIGSTNVGRIAGKRIGFITQLLDMMKGLLPVAIYIFFFDTELRANHVYFIALAAILGHDFSIFLKFKGGKGVNTTLGASVLIAPIAVVVSVAIYLIVKWRFNYVSLGSVIMAITWSLVEFSLQGTGPTLYYLLVCMLIIIVLHRSNIKRLLNNQELLS